MDLRELERNWDTFGKTDPLWAVLTVPDKRLGNWDREEFFETGRVEIDTMLGYVTEAAGRSGRELHRGRALDFGCAVGRLTQALAGRFERTDGVDIAPSMIEIAREWNQHGERCVYHLNEADDLRLFPDSSFDFIYTAHVLQHMEKRYQQRYLAEFVRVLAPGGFGFVEMVSRTVRGATGPLPDDAYRAVVQPSATPSSFEAGASVLLPVTVRNESSVVLPAAGTDGWLMVTAAGRWRDRKGAVVDETHGLLPGDIPPGGSVEVTLCLTAPKQPGTYELELDCVQEGVAWFGDRGSTTTRLPVRIAASRRPLFGRRRQGTQPTPAAGGDAVMEMHGVPEDEVKGWIESAGGQLVEAVDWAALSGYKAQDWERVGYLFTK